MNETRYPVPPGTPEAKAAIERVKRRLAEESRLLAKFRLPGSPRLPVRPGRFCRTCQRPIRTPGEEYCFRHRPRKAGGRRSEDAVE